MLLTDRLVLRRWREADLPAYAALNADPAVIDFSRPMTEAETRAEVADFERRWDEAGFCFAAIERRSDGALLGAAGIARCVMDAPVSPCVEIGWRLARAHWGQGYATEAAAAWLRHGLGSLGLPEIVAFTVPGNLRSLAVMRRLGLRPDPSRTFAHPDVPLGHPFSRHLLHAATAAYLALQ